MRSYKTAWKNSTDNQSETQSHFGTFSRLYTEIDNLILLLPDVPSMITYSSSFPPITPNWGLAVLCCRSRVTYSPGTSSRLSIYVIFQRCIYESWLFSFKKVAFQWTLEYFTVAVYADWKWQCRLLQDAAEAEDDGLKRGRLLCPFCGHSSPSLSLFGPCLLWPGSPISATAELLL